MRIAFIILLLSLSRSLFSQNRFAKELKEIINDSSNHFQNFKGSFKDLWAADSLFNSKFTLEGTIKNDIRFFRGATVYTSIIKDSTNERKGRKIADEWKNKIAAFIGSEFKLTSIERNDWTPIKYGWRFEHGNLWIDVSVFPFFGDNPHLFSMLN